MVEYPLQQPSQSSQSSSSTRLLSEMPESALYDLLLPVIYDRPQLRSRLIDHMISVTPIVQDPIPPPPMRPLAKTLKRKRSNQADVQDNSFLLFTKMRKLVIQSQQPQLSEVDLMKRVKGEWDTLNESNRQIWINLAIQQDSAI